jgi:hypothetical protein
MVECLDVCQKMVGLATILTALAVVAFILGVIGYGYAQEVGGGTTGTMAGCCAMASAHDATDEGNLDVIREFRDEYLMTNPVGRGVAALWRGCPLLRNFQPLGGGFYQ